MPGPGEERSGLPPSLSSPSLLAPVGTHRPLQMPQGIGDCPVSCRPVAGPSMEIRVTSLLSACRPPLLCGSACHESLADVIALRWVQPGARRALLL